MNDTGPLAKPPFDRCSCEPRIFDRLMPEPDPPRKYFCATMFVEFCDHDAGNSTPRCSNAGLAGSPITASRISHSTASKGCTPGCVNLRATVTPGLVRKVVLVSAALPVCCISRSPSLGVSGAREPVTSGSEMLTRGADGKAAARHVLF